MQVVDCGIEVEIAKKALELTSWDVEESIILCTESPEAVLPIEESEHMKAEMIAKSLSLITVPGTGGYFVEFVKYILSRLPSLNKFCMICDRPRSQDKMLSIAPCESELCCWSFQELGVGRH